MSKKTIFKIDKDRLYQDEEENCICLEAVICDGTPPKDCPYNLIEFQNVKKDKKGDK